MLVVWTQCFVDLQARKKSNAKPQRLNSKSIKIYKINVFTYYPELVEPSRFC